MNEFQGQKAVVTGATRGIGRAVATDLLGMGATVIGLFASDEQAADRFRNECAGLAGELFLHRCDVSCYREVEKLYAGIEEDFDTLDILVNNAGIRKDGVLAMMPEQDWRQVIDVNLTGGYNMSKFAVRLMMKQKYGRIIFITSPMSRLGFPGQSNYAAAKAGQVGMMRSLARETAKRKITVNCVSPGFIDTEFLGDLTEDQVREYKKMVPAGRFGTAEEVARAVLFLAGRNASYISGSVLEVTGGL
jgi:3-oxoacyl-[acyl-carrier protein] reductase